MVRLKSLLNSSYSGPKHKTSKQFRFSVLTLLLFCLLLLPIAASEQGAVIAVTASADRALSLVASRLTHYRPTHSYRTVAANTSRTELLRSGGEARAWFSEREGYSELLLVSLEPFDRFERLQLCYGRSSGELETLLDTLIPFGVLSEATLSIDSALCSLGEESDQGALLIHDAPGFVTVSVDGTALHAQVPTLLSAGEYTVCFDSLGCSEVHITAGKITHLHAPQRAAESEPLLLRSGSGAVFWSVGTEVHSYGTALKIEEPVYPLSIGITKEDYMPHLLTVHEPVADEVRVQLQSALPEAQRLLERQQQDFYKGLRNTILLFGAYVTSALFAQNNTDTPLWQVAEVATGALSLVQAIVAVSHLASYGQAGGLL